MSEDYFKETQPQTDTESAPLRVREQDVRTASGVQAEGTDAQSASCPQQPEGENMHPAYGRPQAEGENAQSGGECAQPEGQIAQPASGQPPQGQNMYPAYQQMYVQNPQNNPYMQPGCNGIGMQQPRPKGDGIGFGIASLALGVASVFLFGCCVNYITAVRGRVRRAADGEEPTEEHGGRGHCDCVYFGSAGDADVDWHCREHGRAEHG